MRGHPHPGRRSKWRYILDHKPEILGLYESRCKRDLMNYIFVVEIGPDDCAWLCPQCQWRGLAEKPE